MAEMRMLINARNPEEIRIATIDEDNRLSNFQIEIGDRSLTKGNIYRGIVNNVEPGLDAAFINYGAERNGYLAAHDIVPQMYSMQPRAGSSKPPASEVIGAGAEVLVQVLREPVEKKGAGLTTNLSLIGRDSVLLPFQKISGVSRLVTDKTKSEALQEQANAISFDPGGGWVLRESALGHNKSIVVRDLRMLSRFWKRIQSEAKKGRGPRLLYSDQDILLRALRDHLSTGVYEILIDGEDALQQAQKYFRIFVPRRTAELRLYNEKTPLFERFGIERQIEEIRSRKVALPGGGEIAIDRTEAVVAIDVNSGKSNRGERDKTILTANLEAANEIGRQLMLRNIGGLIVTDFIDMRSAEDRRKVERAMKDSLRFDRARHSIGRISPNGLLEIRRQRLSQALDLQTQQECPTCGGTGRIASTELMVTSLIRTLENRITTSSISAVELRLNPVIADAIQNSKRDRLADLEQSFGVRITIHGSSTIERGDRKIEWTEQAAPAERRESGTQSDMPDRRKT